MFGIKDVRLCLILDGIVKNAMKKLSIVGLVVAAASVGALVMYAFGPSESTVATQEIPKNDDGSGVAVDSTVLHPPESQNQSTDEQVKDNETSSDAEITPDVEIVACHCQGGQFSSNVGSGGSCSANRICQQPIDCQSWRFYADEQLGSGPWPNGSAVTPDQACGLDCEWILSCAKD